MSDLLNSTEDADDQPIELIDTADIRGVVNCS